MLRPILLLGDDMNLKDILYYTRIKINDTNAYRFTDEDMINIVNEAIRFIRNIFIKEVPDMLVDPAIEGVLKSGENSIQLTVQPVQYTDVRCNGKLLHKTSIHSIRDLKRTGEPEFFVITGVNSIAVYPIPTQQIDYSIRVITAPVVVQNNDDVMPFPDDFNDSIIEYTAMRLSLIDEYDQSVEIQLLQQIQSNIINKLSIYAVDEHAVRPYW